MGDLNTKTVNGTEILGDGNVSVEPARTQATQAEMVAGVETGIRSMSPVNVKQAIDANRTSLDTLATLHATMLSF